MILLTIRTDKPEAEIGLYDDSKQTAYHRWEAHKQLSSTIHGTIRDLLESIDLNWRSLGGIVYYEGPGSFTGLRIGATVANTTAAALNVPIVGSSGQDWKETGIQKLLNGANQTIVVPVYGRDPHITASKK